MTNDEIRRNDESRMPKMGAMARIGATSGVKIKIKITIRIKSGVVVGGAAQECHRIGTCMGEEEVSLCRNATPVARPPWLYADRVAGGDRGGGYFSRNASACIGVCQEEGATGAVSEQSQAAYKRHTPVRA